MAISRFAIVIGAMKAGTTSVVQALAKHPRAAVSANKEPGYFAFDEIYQRGPQWYDKLFAFQQGEHDIAVEGSTDYAKFPYCPKSAERIRAFGRDVRLIYMLRHPLRRIESHARHVQRTRKELGQQVSEIDDHSLDAGVSDISLNVSRYAQQLDQYRDFYDSGRLLTLSMESFSRDPAGAMNRICEFLDLDPIFTDAMVHRENAGQNRIQRDRPHVAWRAAKNVPFAHAAYAAVFPEQLRENVRRFFWPKTQLAGRFALTDAEAGALLSTLAPDLRRLQAVYGVDVEREWGLQL